jgi:predicted transcriptional regulator
VVYLFKKNELEVMQVLWAENRPLTHHEIVDLSPNRTWKASTIHFILNGLMAKNAVKVCGSVLSVKIYARQYAAAISKDAYEASQIEQALAGISVDTNRLSVVFSALIKGKEISPDTLDDLQTMIDKLKKASE